MYTGGEGKQAGAMGNPQIVTVVDGKIEEGKPKIFVGPFLLFRALSAGQFEIEMSNVLKMEGNGVQMLLSLG